MAILTLAALAILSWLLLAFAHVHDRYNVNSVSGTLLALADRARDGVLYPPFFDGQSYGGTRTMPLPILLYAFAISLGGDFVAPAKVVDFLSSAALVLLLVGVLIRQGAGAMFSLALASTVVTSQVFLLVATGIRPESLPTALQLGAVALVALVPRRAAIVFAAVLCAVALFCKISALWAPVAIVLWLLGHNRGRLVLFATVFATSTVVLLAVFAFASDGRMLTNLLGLGGAGISVIGVAKAPLKTVELLLQYAQASFVLLPVLLAGILFTSRDARPTIFRIGLIAAVGILLTVMADVGSDYNHLLDVVVLLPIVTYEVVRNLASRIADPRPALSFMAASILVGSSAALAVNAGTSLAATLQLPGASQQSFHDPRPLVVELSEARSVLAEDPYLHLSRGERPIVLDAFMFLRIGQRDPGLVEPLLATINDERFDAIVLNEDLRQPDAAIWFRDFAFGVPFYRAMRDNYRLCSANGGYFLYFANSLPCPEQGYSRSIPAPVTTDTYTVPGTIDATGATDVSTDLNDWIDTVVPDGSIIEFPSGGTFQLSEGIQLGNREHLAFQGNGSTVELTGAAGDHLSSGFIVGYSYGLASFTGGSSHIAISDFTIVGNDPTPGTFGGGENQQAVRCTGSTFIEVDNTVVSAVHGDGVYIDNCEDVWIHHNHVVTAGRNGLTVVEGARVLAEDNDYDRVGYVTFDDEPNESSEASTDITFRNNTAGTWGQDFVSIDGGHRGAPIHGITITGNITTGRPLTCLVDNGGAVRMTNIVFSNNTSAVAGGRLRFAHVDGLTVTGNSAPASISDSTGVSYP